MVNAEGGIQLFQDTGVRALNANIHDSAMQKTLSHNSTSIILSVFGKCPLR